MKAKIWVHHLLGAIFALMLSVSAVGNLVTGYNLQVESLKNLFLWCTCFSFLSALILRLKRGEVILLALGLFFLPALWKGGALWDQTQTLCRIISYHYHEIYNWPVIGKMLADDLSQFFIALSAWSAITVSWIYCRRKPIYAALLPIILPLIICLITTDRVPDPIYLYLLTLGVAMLLATDWTRRKHPAQSNKLVLRFMIPMATALALLFSLNPQQTYVNQAGKYQKEVLSWFQQLQDTTESLGNNVSFESAQSEKLNLRYVGPKRKSTRSIMRVNATVDGIIYLRGRDYDIYSGTGWETSQNRTEGFSSGIDPYGRISINTYSTMDVRYIPYYTNEVLRLTDGALDNEDDLQQYTYDLCEPIPSSLTPDASYLDLPPETEVWAKELTNRILDYVAVSATIPDHVKADRIASYVRDSAAYDLSTSRMDAGHSDFARWFLEESDTGYCVHFASAATVLLRAAGIPARYVEGYMVNCTADQNVIVQAQDAHAWAEYYDSELGVWRVLEATPAEELEDETTVPSTSEQPTEGDPDSPTTTPMPTDSDAGQTATEPHTQDKPQTPGVLPGETPGASGIKEPFRLPDWIWTLFRILLVSACIPLQSSIRKRWKAKKWNQGHHNTMTLNRWRQIKQIARLLHTPIPEELDHLAQKAKFSQHTISLDELQLFDSFRNGLLISIKELPWYRRLLLSWIFALG